MTEMEFNWQLKRIENQFGKYGTERGSILWDKVQHLSDAWMRKTVDSFISSSRHTPTPEDFQAPVAEETQRLWRLKKETEQREIKDFWDGKYLVEEEKEILNQIKKKMASNETNKVLGIEPGPDPAWDKYVKHLENAASWPWNTWQEYQQWQKDVSKQNSGMIARVHYESLP